MFEFGASHNELDSKWFAHDPDLVASNATSRYRSVYRTLDYFRFADYPPSGEPISSF